jgi:hypothetical protein
MTVTHMMLCMILYAVIRKDKPSLWDVVFCLTLGSLACWVMETITN